MLNFCYDVPVKLYSAHILLMAACLVLPDAQRLWNVLLANRPTAPLDLGPPPAGPRWTLARRVLKYVFIASALASQIVSCMRDSRMSDQKHELYGLYEVEDFSRNGASEEATLANKGRWRSLSVNEYGGVWVRNRRFEASCAADEKTRPSRSPPQRRPRGTPDARLHKPDDQPYIRRQARRDALVVKLKKLPLPQFQLTTRGFHWIRSSPTIARGPLSSRFRTGRAVEVRCAVAAKRRHSTLCPTSTAYLDPRPRGSNFSLRSCSGAAASRTRRGRPAPGTRRSNPDAEELASLRRGGRHRVADHPRPPGRALSASNTASAPARRSRLRQTTRRR
jgi:hypothetical protein